VHARDDLHLGVERTDVRQPAAVDAGALGEDATTHDLLRDGLVRRGELQRGRSRERARLGGLDELGLDAVLDRVVSGLTLDLVGDLVDIAELGERALGDEAVDLVAVRGEDRVDARLLRRGRGELGLSLDELGDERLRGLEALGHDLLVRLGGAGLDQVPAALGGLSLDHHDGDVFRAIGLGDDATGDDQVEHGLRDLLGGRERDPLVRVLAVTGDEREAHTGDGTRERQTRDLGRRRSGVDRESVVELARCDREDGDDNLDLVAQAVDERRTQRTVDQTADEDRLGGGTTLTTEERAGDLAGGVGALLDVDRQREEVEALARVLACAGGREEHGLAVEVGGDCALSLLREAAGLEADGAGAEAAVVENGLGGGDFRTFQEVSPSLFRLASPCDARACSKERSGRVRARGHSRECRLRWPPVESHPTSAEEPTTGDQLLRRSLRESI